MTQEKKVEAKKDELRRKLKDKEDELKNLHTTWLGLLLILLAIGLVVLLSLVGRGPIASIQLKEGISVFAVFYLMAQLIERVVEPFTEKKRPTKKNGPTGDANTLKSAANTEADTRAFFGDTDRIDALREMVATAEEPKEKELDEKLLDRHTPSE